MPTPDAYRAFLPWENDLGTPLTADAGDDRSGRVYLQDLALKLAAEMAIVTRRPLLIRGEPGTGKSSFAPFAARNLGWRYYEKAVTGRLEARDLLWTFDALERLRDAQRQQDVTADRYVTPGILWWAFNRRDALSFLDARQGLRGAGGIAIREPSAVINQARDADRAVVLIDEIDKADPEVPNDLLEVLGLNRFDVEDLSRPVLREAPPLDPDPGSPNHFGSLLIVITTNEERELPSAFMRRCVVHSLREPVDRESQVQRMEEIAALHMADLMASKPQGKATVNAVANKFCEIRERTATSNRRKAGTAEFLDAARVCLRLNITPDSETWKQVAANVIVK